MSWGHDHVEGWVACDAGGCTAVVTHPVSLAVDGVSACTYASEKALTMGWRVPSRVGALDYCARHARNRGRS